VLNRSFFIFTINPALLGFLKLIRAGANIVPALNLKGWAFFVWLSKSYLLSSGLLTSMFYLNLLLTSAIIKSEDDLSAKLKLTGSGRATGFLG